MRRTCFVLSGLVGALGLCAGAGAAIVPGNGSIHVHAAASAPGSGSQSLTPPDVTYVGAYSTFSHHVKAVGGSAGAEITNEISFTPNMIQWQMTGYARKVFTQNFAEASGSFAGAFTLDAAATLEFRAEETAVNGSLGTTIKDSNGTSVFVQNLQNFQGPITKTMTLPAGQYTFQTFDFIDNDTSVVSMTATQTLTIVPEPTSLVALITVPTLAMRRRGRR